MVEVLVQHGADVNLIDDEGEMPLFIAAGIGKFCWLFFEVLLLS